MKRLNLLATLAACALTSATAQTWDSLCVEQKRIDTGQVGVLRAEVDAMTFFQNNEFKSEFAEGYTLPGAWVQPRLVYAPLPQLQIEAGAHVLFLHGANRYPNYAYHDIAQWKGDQYQQGAHGLPFFRVQADLGKLSFVMGNIYGGQSHGLILPMWNPEQNLSTDPETGFQLMADSRRSHLDLWLNWQSFIFNYDGHQEAFTVGMNFTQQWGRAGSGPLTWETPVQFLVQHRGGEIDATDRGVQTVWNAAAGVRATLRPANQRTVNSLRAEANLLASYQQTGHLWPFDAGLAMHGAVRGTFWRHLGAELGLMYIPRQFANLYGSPFFSSVSLKNGGEAIGTVKTAYATVSYTYEFARGYALGAQLDYYSPHAPVPPSSPFGVGLYFRVRPSFFIGERR